MDEYKKSLLDTNRNSIQFVEHSLHNENDERKHITDLKAIYTQIIENGISIDHKQNDMVNTLGGINEILNVYFEHSNIIPLNDHQINQLYDILNSQKQSQQSQCCCNCTNTAESTGISYYFSRNDTYLHYWFGLKYGTKIFELMHHKITMYGMILISVFLFIMRWTHLFHAWKGIYIYSLGSVNIYILFLVVSINRKCARLLIKSFEFWVKLLYSVKLGICYIILDLIQFHKIADVGWISWIILVLLFSVYDGLQLPRYMKLFFTVMTACWATIEAVRISVGYSHYTISGLKTNINFEIFGTEHEVDMVYELGTAYRVLAIFIWKQTIATFRRKDKAVTIRSSAYIKWS